MSRFIAAVNVFFRSEHRLRKWGAWDFTIKKIFLFDRIVCKEIEISTKNQHKNLNTVTYWPSAEPSIKKQVHPVEDIGISPWPVDVVEFGADAYANRKQVKQLYNQVSNNYITRCYRRLELVGVRGRQADSQFRSFEVRVAVPVGDKMPEWEPLPDRWLGFSGLRLSSPAEWGRSAAMVRGTWGVNVLQSLSISNSPLTHN